jgi:hypothetical protein
MTRGFALASLASLAIISQAGSAHAQWVTSGTTVTNQGPVGVGTTTPVTPLHVEGTIFTTGSAATFRFRDRGGSAYTDDWSLYSVDGTARFSHWGPGDAFAITSDGHVGIGTIAPTQALGEPSALGRTFQLHSPANIASFRITRAAVGTIEIGRITFGSTGYQSTEKRTALITSWSDTNPNTDPTGSLRFSTANAGTLAERMRITGAGRVGIGTTTPAAALHVVGDVAATGGITAYYQDVAEWVPSKQKLAAGTVVVLDIEHDNHVTTTSEAYDTRVAGVVSERPGLLLGAEGEGKVKVATTGRVRMKVDATRAPVRIGDLLVTSEREGWAMKSEPIVVGGRKIHTPGTVVGKALEPLAGGMGEILVLLTLQ